MRLLHAVILAVAFAITAAGQVYSPKVLLKGQPDASDLRSLARGIYAQAGARTPRQRAEAVWRFFLTDGRFVKPGFWYHIAGWAFEEPMGEVLDPVKLLNSYGFGLCYHIAPLLESVWKAGGFADARVWFLTGHTVAEVFYDGAYHYYDSDMMGYNPVGRGSPRELPVASVHQIELDGNIILSKLKGPKEVDAAAVEAPWYPADVREAAIDGLASLFTSAADNWLFPFERAPQGHSMSFELRPGERLIRYFEPKPAGLYYLPYQSTGRAWEEFPREIAEYRIKTADGPRSQKDERRWATGLFEYRLPIRRETKSIFEVHSPYVIVDAQFQFDAVLSTERQTMTVETSTDEGRTWSHAGTLRGPHRGAWRILPAVLTRSDHGRRTAVSGSYGYLVRVTRAGGAPLRGGLLRTRIQLNPRTLPELAAGRNQLVYTAGPAMVRRAITAEPSHVTNAHYVSDGAQGYWVPASEHAVPASEHAVPASGHSVPASEHAVPASGEPGEFVFRLTGPNGAPLAGFDAGGRFLDLSTGLAPDKFTAEVRKVAPFPANRAANHPAASIAWSESPDGPFQTIWAYDPLLKWRDGIAIDRTLLWPEVDRHVEVSGAPEVYVRYRIRGLALDNFRLAVETRGRGDSSALEVTHVWREDGTAKTRTQRIPAGSSAYRYAVEIPKGAKVVNEAVIFECPAKLHGVPDDK